VGVREIGARRIGMVDRSGPGGGSDSTKVFKEAGPPYEQRGTHFLEVWGIGKKKLPRKGTTLSPQRTSAVKMGVQDPSQKERTI